MTTQAPRRLQQVLLSTLLLLVPASARIGGQQHSYFYRQLQGGGGVSCPPGEEPIAGACTQCRPGSFSESTGSDLCTACPPGQIQPDYGQTSCFDCSPGTFNLPDAINQHSCQQCAPGFYQPLSGQTSCLLCCDPLSPLCTATSDGSGPCSDDTAAPTSTSAPGGTDPPTPSPTSELDGGDGSGGISGDPHIQKWDGNWYDYNGECDMVFVTSPKLEIHVRTKLRYGYSYIESAAIKMGDDVLEISSWGEWAVNGVNQAAIQLKTGTRSTSAILPPMGDGSSSSVRYKQVDEKKHRFVIQIDTNHFIKITTYKDFVNVELNIHGTAGTTRGLMGEFGTGRLVARDGKTILTDFNDFGQEWQVAENEPKLFRINRAPQAPYEKCRLPPNQNKKSSDHEAKQADAILKQAATKACKEHAHQNIEACIADILATGDFELVESGGY